MASWSEIDRQTKDPVGAALLARGLLKYSRDGLTDWELDFLEGMAERKATEDLSTRQAEKLLQIRDDVERIATFRGFSIRSLVLRCHEARNDLDEDDEIWIAELFALSTDRIRRRLVGRLLRCARQLHLVDSHLLA